MGRLLRSARLHDDPDRQAVRVRPTRPCSWPSLTRLPAQPDSRSRSCRWKATCAGAQGARRMNAAIEAAVRKHPEQYLWGYNRYKQPAGAPPPPGGGEAEEEAGGAAAHVRRRHAVSSSVAWLRAPHPRPPTSPHDPPRHLRALAPALPSARRPGPDRPGRSACSPMLCIPKRRRIARTNLRLCFPELTDAEREQLLRRHFRAFGRAILESGIAWWGSPERLRRSGAPRGDGTRRRRAKASP